MISVSKNLDLSIGTSISFIIFSSHIPFLLKNKDFLGQAQTGTGKTAAFALPLLSNLNLKQKEPQKLVKK